MRLYELAKPTIAALPGAAAGAGFSIALACDLRVAAEDAFMLTSEVYRYMNFDQIESFQKSAEQGKLIAAQQIVEVA